MKTAKDYVEGLDWMSAIATATLELDLGKENDTKLTGEEKATAYRYRGIARCFVENKDGYKAAVEDISTALCLNTQPQAVSNDEVYYYRAFAFYLDGNYEKALADCDLIVGLNQYREELRGKIYLATCTYEKAAQAFKDAIQAWHTQNALPPPGLLENYRDACKRMNSV